MDGCLEKVGDTYKIQLNLVFDVLFLVYRILIFSKSILVRLWSVHWKFMFILQHKTIVFLNIGLCVCPCATTI